MFIVCFSVILYIVLCFIGSIVWRLVRGREKVVVYKYLEPALRDYGGISETARRIEEEERLDIGAEMRRIDELAREDVRRATERREEERRAAGERLYPGGPAEYRVVVGGEEKVLVKGSDEYDEMYKLIHEA